MSTSVTKGEPYLPSPPRIFSPAISRVPPFHPCPTVPENPPATIPNSKCKTKPTVDNTTRHLKQQINQRKNKKRAEHDKKENNPKGGATRSIPPRTLESVCRLTNGWKESQQPWKQRKEQCAGGIMRSIVTRRTGGRATTSDRTAASSTGSNARWAEKGPRGMLTLLVVVIVVVEHSIGYCFSLALFSVRLGFPRSGRGPSITI
jgi:hypothetical protein